MVVKRRGMDMNKKSCSFLNECLIFLGVITSRLGNLIFDFVNNYYLARVHVYGPILIAIYRSTETISTVALGLIGGSISDRFNKKQILVITDLLSGIICLILSFLTDSYALAILIIIANIALALISTFNDPTSKSIIPLIMNKERITSFNSVLNIGLEIIKVISPLLGMAILLTVGVKGSLFLNAITFFASAILEYRLRILTEAVKNSNTEKVLSNIKQGLIYLKSSKFTWSTR